MTIPETTDDTICVYLRDCTVSLFVGIYDYEKPQPQPVIFDIELAGPLRQRYDDLQASHLSLIIDYDRLYQYVTQTLPTLGHVPLLESLAERIIDFCFGDSRVTAVTVKLRKPDILKGKASVGIEMRRSRKTP